jgi:hypothetical protein
MRILLALVVSCVTAVANAGIVVNTVSTVTNINDTTANVSVVFFAGSDTASNQPVSIYQVQVDVSTVTGSANFNGPFGAGSVVFANPGGDPSTSLWATPNNNSPFGSFSGSPGSVAGSLVTFLGSEGNGFGNSVPITPYAANAAHRMGTLNFTFTRPNPAAPDITFNLTPVNGVFRTRNPPEGGQNSTLIDVNFQLNGDSFTITGVPEPSSLLLCLGSTLVFGCARRARSRR